MVFELNQEFFNQIFFFVLFFGFMFVYPRLMLTQMLFQLDRTVRGLEENSLKGRSIAIKKASKSPSRAVRDSITQFMDFFVIEPVGIDPAGAMKRIEHLSNLGDKRFRYFVKNVAPQLGKEEQANMAMTLAGTVSLHQVMKIVRHYVEIVRKTRNLQIAMILQMQLPFIERVSRAMLKGTEAFANGWPVGDTVGPLVASHLIGDGKSKDIADDETVVVKRRIKGRNVIVMRAKGPGGRLGKLGRAVEILSRRGKIAKVITVDAAAKLEGEKTGAIAEGIGVAIGGIGVDRGYIEKIATEKDIPLDTIVVKMSQEEAIMPMRMEILNAVPSVLKMVERNVQETAEKGDIIIIGVGNCTGVDNDKKGALKAELLIKKVAAQVKKQEAVEEKDRKKFSNRFLGM
ncbi:MAG: DUF1512 family protein [Candidatus Aenigmarchaeota archaeon]|nr:DUF1512 family protein [Candidatus Aenigmarchaeota archaeon]